jgi:hypothetical protein
MERRRLAGIFVLCVPPRFDKLSVTPIQALARPSK